MATNKMNVLNRRKGCTYVSHSNKSFQTVRNPKQGGLSAITPTQLQFHGGIGCIGTTTLNGARAAISFALILVMTSYNPTSGNK
jgi:hypothetical protein